MPLALQGPAVAAAFPVPPQPHRPASASAPDGGEGRMLLRHQRCSSRPHPVLFSQGWAASFSLQLPLLPPRTHHHFRAASSKLSGSCRSCTEPSPWRAEGAEDRW